MGISLGDQVQDLVTGYKGIVIARTEWMYGCVRYIVQSQELKDGAPVLAQTFDEPQLQLMRVGAVPNRPAPEPQTIPPPPPKQYGDRPVVTRGHD